MSTDPVKIAATAAERGRVRMAISTCTRCTLAPGRINPDSGKPTSARRQVPFYGPTPARLMILGEAPGATEDRQGRPFVGASGELLARLLRDAGLPTLNQWFIANSVSCRSVGPPALDQLLACRPNVAAQVAVADPEWVLALGAVALSTVEVVGKITQIHGRPFKVPHGPFIGRWVLPTLHPAAALRDAKKLPEIAADLSTLRNLLSGNISPDDIGVKVGRGGRITTNA